MEKSELKNYRVLVAEVQQLREQLSALEASMYSPKGQRFTSTPRTASGYNSTMDGVVTRHIAVESLYREALADKEAQQLTIERAIQSLGDTPERVVMRERYIKGRGWTGICRDMQKLGFSERRVYRIHGLALLKLKEV